MMRLTPEDVHNIEFAGAPRFKPGYDEAEVDDFLNKIAEGLAQLFDENGDLQRSLRAGGPPVPPLNMTLTPAVIQGKQFTSTKRRAGYNEEEVDDFLDTAEASFADLIRENGQLRADLEARMQSDRPPVLGAEEPGPTAAPEAEQRPQPKRKPPEPQPEPEPEPMPAPELREPDRDIRRPAPKPRGPERRRPVTEPERRRPAPEPERWQPEPGMMGTVEPYSIDAAARVLALAQQTADQAISEARQEANRTLTGASRRAEQITSDAQARADTLERDARARAEALEEDARKRHYEVVGSLVEQREELERRIEALHATEAEYRRKLKQELQGMLRDLDDRRGNGSSRAA